MACSSEKLRRGRQAESGGGGRQEGGLLRLRSAARGGVGTERARAERRDAPVLGEEQPCQVVLDVVKDHVDVAEAVAERHQAVLVLQLRRLVGIDGRGGTQFRGLAEMFGDGGIDMRQHRGCRQRRTHSYAVEPRRRLACRMPMP